MSASPFYFIAKSASKEEPHMPNALGKLPTPLEAVDTLADLANQVARTPFRVVGNALTAAGQTFKNIESDLARPADYAEIPPPPDVLVGSVISGVSHLVQGALNTAKGAVEGVVETGDGLRKEIQQMVGR